MDAERPRWASGGTESRRRKRGAQPYGLLYAIEPQYLGPRSIPAPLKIGYTRDQASLEQRRADRERYHECRCGLDEMMARIGRATIPVDDPEAPPTRDPDSGGHA